MKDGVGSFIGSVALKFQKHITRKALLRSNEETHKSNVYHYAHLELFEQIVVSIRTFNNGVNRYKSQVNRQLTNFQMKSF